MKLNAWKKQVLDASSTPGPQLSTAMKGLLDTANTHIQEVGLFVSLSLADCDSKLYHQLHVHTVIIMMSFLSNRALRECIVVIVTNPLS